MKRTKRHTGRSVPSIKPKNWREGTLSCRWLQHNLAVGEQTMADLGSATSLRILRTGGQFPFEISVTIHSPGGQTMAPDLAICTGMNHQHAFHASGLHSGVGFKFLWKPKCHAKTVKISPLDLKVFSISSSVSEPIVIPNLRIFFVCDHRHDRKFVIVQFVSCRNQYLIHDVSGKNNYCVGP